MPHPFRCRRGSLKTQNMPLACVCVLRPCICMQVKKELPDATERFAKIDKDVKGVLSKFKAKKNCVECCNQVCVCARCWLRGQAAVLLPRGVDGTWQIRFSVLYHHPIIHYSRVHFASFDLAQNASFEKVLNIHARLI